ncbi:MAG: hypothetical protein ACK5LE_04960 [Alphaproteobacteria bacterium]
MPQSNENNNKANQSNMNEDKKPDVQSEEKAKETIEKKADKSTEPPEKSVKEPPKKADATVKDAPKKPEDTKAKPADKPAKPKSEKPKKSISGFMWPVLCSVAVAGGLIATEDMWVKKSNNQLDGQITEVSQLAETNKTAITQLVNQAAEIEALKAQIAQLTAQDPKALIGPIHDDVMALNGRLDSDITTMNKTVSELKGDYARINAQTDGLISQLQAVSQMATEGASPEIKQRLDALEVARRQAVSALEGQVTTLTQSLDDIKKQQPAFEVFDRRVNDLEGQVTQLSDNITNLQNTVESGAVNSSKFLAVDNLARQIDLGENYSNSLAALVMELPPQAAEAVTMLQQNIGKIKPLYQLQGDFNDVSRQIIIAERKDQAAQNGDKKQSLLSNLNELVTISRNDGGADGSADRLVYNIKNALQSGDLATVEQLLSAASPAAQDAAATWSSEVKAKIQAEEALTQIRNSLAQAGE